MRKLITTAQDLADTQRRFYSVAETARIMGVSEMTLYRAIRTGQFPAVQLMGRLIIPAKVIDEMIDAAIDSGAVVDTEQWTPVEAGMHTPHRRRSERAEEGAPN